MQVQPYLFFDGRAEEAIEFYKKAVGAEVGMLMRWKDSPEKSMCTPNNENKVMHASLKIGNTQVMASDGRNKGHPDFKGFALSLDAKDEADADRLFNALSDGRKNQHAADQDVLLAALRHVRRQVRRELDGYRRAEVSPQY